jgi:hypothetical protein
VPIERLREPPRAVPLLQGQQTLYEVDLSAEPSSARRAAFLRPPVELLTSEYTPELGRVGSADISVHFRLIPPWDPTEKGLCPEDLLSMNPRAQDAGSSVTAALGEGGVRCASAGTAAGIT